MNVLDMFALPRVSCAGLEVTAGPGRRAYQLAARPRVFECADCGRQHSVTAGTVFHRTRTPAAQMVRCGMADRARQARRLGAVSRARTGAALRHSLADAHKLRHGLSERPEYLLDGLIEIDESYYGGRGEPASRGRGLTDPNKSLMAIAVEPSRPRRGRARASRKATLSAAAPASPSCRPPLRRIWVALSAAPPSPAPASSLMA